MTFEWDPKKEASNRAKHDGIDFETATTIFADPWLVLRKDRVVDGELRWHGIGMGESTVLIVVHVYVEEGSNGQETIRIISARRADSRERRVYLEQAAD